MDHFQTASELLAQGARTLQLVKYKLMYLQHIQDQLHAAMRDLMAQASGINHAAPTPRGDAPQPPLLKKDSPQ